MEPGRIHRALSLAVVIVALWMTLPEHTRRLWLMRAARAAQHLAGHAASREGRQGMRDELDGRGGDAARRYAAAFRLSLARDKMARVLEALRP